MSFSAFNVGRQMMDMTSNKLPQNRFGSKPVAGGSFTPSTLEAAFVMRSSLDYQFEKAFNDKYKAQMQNRLNELSKRLQEAYTDLLNTSMAQQIGQEADAHLRADVKLDGNDGSGGAALIDGVAGENGFEDIGIIPKSPSRAGDLNETAVNYLTPGAVNSGDKIWRAPGMTYDRLDPNYPSANKYADDGMSGYGRRLGGDEVQFRTLLDHTTAGGNVAGELNITMRLEDDPPIPEEADFSTDLLNTVTSFLLGGPPDPTYFNQKVDQNTTNYKTGGFWSTVNYLYNFAPREMKYTYAVGYTVNSDEAGNDQYLINGELVDDRDIPGPGQAYTDKDKRLKWTSFDPTEGYTHERSGTINNYPTVINREKAWVDGVDNSANGVRAIWDNNFTDAEGQVKIVENLIFQSGTYIYDGTFVNEQGKGDPVPGTIDRGGGLIVQYSGTSATGLTSLLESNIELGSIFRQKVDLEDTGAPLDKDGNPIAGGVLGSQDDEIPPSTSQDFKVTARGANRSSLFYNHYEVETRTVEFNNSKRNDVDELWDPSADPFGTPDDVSDDGIGKVYAFGGMVRSKSVDASKNYDYIEIDHDNDPTTAKVKEISRNSGNVNGTYNGEFVQSLHKITSVNGQDIVGNDKKQASPVLGGFEIGKYEGIMRSQQMSRNIVDYVAPLAMDIDASGAVPTDWHQAELLAPEGTDPTNPMNGHIWFPFIEDTLFSRIPGGTTTDQKTGYGRPGAPRQLIQARNSFNLKKEEFMTLNPAAGSVGPPALAPWVSDPSGNLRPTYTKKDYIIDINLRGIHGTGPDYTTDTQLEEQPKLFVNGREVNLMPPDSETEIQFAGSGAWNITKQVNLRDYLQEGENTIVIQTSDAAYNVALAQNNYEEGIRITAGVDGAGASLNTPEVIAQLNAKVITGYDNQQAVAYNSELERSNTLKIQSRWQTRIVPTTVELDTTNKLASMASTSSSTGSSFKVANSFVELIIDMINQRKYRDIFRMGLMSNLNKLAIQGQANLPNGSSMQGAVTMYYDASQQRVVLVQDKLIGNS